MDNTDYYSTLPLYGLEPENLAADLDYILLHSGSNNSEITPQRSEETFALKSNSEKQNKHFYNLNNNLSQQSGENFQKYKNESHNTLASDTSNQSQINNDLQRKQRINTDARVNDIAIQDTSEKTPKKNIPFQETQSKLQFPRVQNEEPRKNHAFDKMESIHTENLILNGSLSKKDYNSMKRNTFSLYNSDVPPGNNFNHTDTDYTKTSSIPLKNLIKYDARSQLFSGNFLTLSSVSENSQEIKIDNGASENQAKDFIETEKIKKIHLLDSIDDNVHTKVYKSFVTDSSSPESGTNNTSNYTSGHELFRNNTNPLIFNPTVPINLYKTFSTTKKLEDEQILNATKPLEDTSPQKNRNNSKNKFLSSTGSKIWRKFYDGKGFGVTQQYPENQKKSFFSFNSRSKDSFFKSFRKGHERTHSADWTYNGGLRFGRYPKNESQAPDTIFAEDSQLGDQKLNNLYFENSEPKDETKKDQNDTNISHSSLRKIFLSVSELPKSNICIDNMGNGKPEYNDGNYKNTNKTTIKDIENIDLSTSVPTFEIGGKSNRVLGENSAKRSLLNSINNRVNGAKETIDNGTLHETNKNFFNSSPIPHKENLILQENSDAREHDSYIDEMSTNNFHDIVGANMHTGYNPSSNDGYSLKSGTQRLKSIHSTMERKDIRNSTIIGSMKDGSLINFSKKQGLQKYTHSEIKTKLEQKQGSVGEESTYCGKVGETKTLASKGRLVLTRYRRSHDVVEFTADYELTIIGWGDLITLAIGVIGIQTVFYDYWAVPIIPVVVYYIYMLLKVKKERLVVVRDVGVQIESQKFVGFKSIRLIDLENIKDVVIHEGLSKFRYRFFLSILLNSNEYSAVVFPSILPELPFLKPVYYGTKEFLFKTKNQ
ncbi:hypothetical protein BB558_006045 [Smittium angustum]|uniref:Phosphatidylinositol N-acetylglucosaminyltransferase subunit H conserved domain-containing protein n=1 Tax=Smittium angustum TaxID=133377 RepID=A0A2U1IYS4_SMIAN|nr:hypothetical protein BB558_006045 [Smittium angustum]